MEKAARTVDSDITLKDIVIKLRSYIKFLKSKWVLLFIWGALGGTLGLLYAIFKKPMYTATCSFVLDETKTSGLSQYAGLASIAGIDLGDGAGSVFEGDNIAELYTSRSMIAKTLMCETDINGKQALLIDRYIIFLNLRNTWNKEAELSNISFQGPINKFGRKQDSLLIDIATKIDEKVLSVGRPDKKLGIINVNVTFGDELFAKQFNDSLVANVNDFYIKTKTKKTSSNVQVLQKQADSVKVILNNSISGIASSLDASPNANPLLLSLKVPSQKKQIDLQSSSAIYAEIVKNLELAKISLRQETPLIQVIDNPMLPLTVSKPGKVKSSILGIILGVFVTIFFITVKKAYQNLMN